MENSQHTDTKSLEAWSEAGRRMALLMVLEQIHFPARCAIRYRSHSKNFWVLPKFICILQKYWWVCTVWSAVCHLMQHLLLLQKILSPEKMLNFFFFNCLWSFSVLHKGDTNCAKGFQFAYGLPVRECGRTGMWSLKTIHLTRSLSVGSDKVWSTPVCCVCII